jgi:hypothetical protein
MPTKRLRLISYGMLCLSLISTVGCVVTKTSRPPDITKSTVAEIINPYPNTIFVLLKNCGHSFIPVGGALSPSQNVINKMIADFFDRYLKT